MKMEVINALIASSSAIIGAIIGGTCSIYGSKIATDKNIKAQERVFKEKNDLENQKIQQTIQINAKIIYYDIASALYEAFMIRKNKANPGIGHSPIQIPMYTEYSSAIVSLSNNISAKEIFLLNKLYAIIEKIRNDIMQINYLTSSSNDIEIGCLALLGEAFGDKYIEILKYDEGYITQDYIMEQLKLEYKNLFNKIVKIGEIGSY